MLIKYPDGYPAILFQAIVVGCVRDPINADGYGGRGATADSILTIEDQLGGYDAALEEALNTENTS